MEAPALGPALSGRRGLAHLSEEDSMTERRRHRHGSGRGKPTLLAGMLAAGLLLTACPQPEDQAPPPQEPAEPLVPPPDQPPPAPPDEPIPPGPGGGQ